MTAKLIKCGKNRIPYNQGDGLTGVWCLNEVMNFLDILEVNTVYGTSHHHIQIGKKILFILIYFF